MSTNNFFRSDLPTINNVAQNSMIIFPKEIVIATLREFFSKDSFYAYHKDEWGFAKTVDHTNLPPDAGLADNLTTRLFIGESFRQDVIFYPAIIVRHGGANYTPISMNRERGTIQWDFITYQDGYGNSKVFRSPQWFVFAGAWEGSLSVEIQSRSMRARDDLTELVSLLFTDIQWDNLKNAGLIIKAVQAGSATEGDDRNNKLFKTTITLQFRSEWRRHIPIGNVVEVINFSMDFGQLPAGPIAPNISITNQQTLIDLLGNL